MERMALGGLSRRLRECSGVAEALGVAVSAVADLSPESIAVAALFDPASRRWTAASVGVVPAAPGDASGDTPADDPVAPGGPGGAAPALAARDGRSTGADAWRRLGGDGYSGAGRPDLAPAAQRAGLDVTQVDLDAGESPGLLALLQPAGSETAVAASDLRLLLTDAAAQTALAIRAQTASERLGRLEQEQRDQQLFLSVAAHDLRTPLASIRGSAQLLLRQRSAPVTGAQRTGLETIIHQADRLAGLTETVLDVARIQTRRMALRLTTADLGQIARQEAGVVGGRSGAPGVDLVLPETGPLLRGDVARLGQVTRVLLEFAAARTADGQRVALRLEPDDHDPDHVPGRPGVRLCVEDAGPALDEAASRGLFSQLVEQGPEGTSPALGQVDLYIARGVAEAHGGRAWAETPVPDTDGGLRLNVWLPLQD
jgi:signal transduction histidine kinase